MQRDTLKIGARTKSKRPQFEAPFNRPENGADCLKLCNGNEAVVAKLFTRGYAIFLQDRIGRPMFEAGASEPEILAAIAAAVPGVTKGVSHARPPLTVALPKGQKTFSPEEVTRMLAAKGITVTTL